MTKGNKFLGKIYFNLLASPSFFNSIVENIYEESKLYENKSMSIQTNMLIIGIFPILLVFRYITSNILWFFGFTIISFIIYAIIYVQGKFWFRIIRKLER